MIPERDYPLTSVCYVSYFGNKKFDVYYQLVIDRLMVTDSGYSIFRATLYRDIYGIPTNGKFLNDLQSSIFYVAKTLPVVKNADNCYITSQEFVPFFLSRSSNELLHRFFLGLVNGCDKPDDFLKNRFTKRVHIRLDGSDTSNGSEKQIDLVSLGAIKRKLSKSRFNDEADSVQAVAEILDRCLKSEARAKKKLETQLKVAEAIRAVVDQQIRTYNHQAEFGKQIEPTGFWVAYKEPTASLRFFDKRFNLTFNIMPCLAPDSQVSINYPEFSCDFHCNPDSEYKIVNFLKAVAHLDAALHDA